MRGHIIEIPTEVYRLLQDRAHGHASWSDEKPGPIQRIVLNDEAYRELIDRAIAERKALDRVICENLCKEVTAAEQRRKRDFKAGGKRLA